MDIQEVYNRAEAIKAKMKDIRAAYKATLNGTPDYAHTLEQLKVLKEKKKQIENAVKQEMVNDLKRLEDMAIDLASDEELLSDIALSQYVKGETVVVEDQYGNKYDPAFKVKFKKQ